ncbi:hypothetical protein ACVMB3_007061 [Sinorhizobium meliloti]
MFEICNDLMLAHFDAVRGSSTPTIFVSLELSHSKWLITSLQPGSEKMSKHVVAAGNVAGLLDRFAELRRKAEARTGRCYPIIVIQEAGLDGFWIHRVLQAEGIESHVADAASIATSRGRRRAKTTGSTVRRWSGRCWPTSEASHGCARRSGADAGGRRPSPHLA